MLETDVPLQHFYDFKLIFHLLFAILPLVTSFPIVLGHWVILQLLTYVAFLSSKA